MPRLVGTEEWNEDNLRDKVRYYLGSLSSGAELTRVFAPRERAQGVERDDERQFYQDVVNVRLEQFTEAVALLLVSDHTEEALRLLADPGVVLNGYSAGDSPNGYGRVPMNVRQFVGLSLFATLAKHGDMKLGEDGLEYVTKQGLLVLVREAHSEHEFLAVLPTLFYIAVAGKVGGEVLYYISSQFNELSRLYGALGIFDSPEAELLGVYRTFFISEAVGFIAESVFGQLDGFIALRELEKRYTRRIREMRNDRYHWVRMNAPGDLIDWVLLIAQVAMLRRDRLLFCLRNFPFPRKPIFVGTLRAPFSKTF